MNDVRLRLLAIERGEQIDNPPSIEEIQQALIERIGNRNAALLLRTEKVATKKQKTPARGPILDIDI